MRGPWSFSKWLIQRVPRGLPSAHPQTGTPRTANEPPRTRTPARLARLAWGSFIHAPASQLLRLHSQGVQLKPGAEVVCPYVCREGLRTGPRGVTASLPPSPQSPWQRPHPVHTLPSVPMVTAQGLPAKAPFLHPTPTPALTQPFQLRGHNRLQGCEIGCVLETPRSPERLWKTLKAALCQPSSP